MSNLDFSLFETAAKSGGKKGESKFNFANPDFCDFAGIPAKEVSQFEKRTLRIWMRKYITKICLKYGAKIATKSFSQKDAEIFETSIINCLTSKNISDVGKFEIIGAKKRILGEADTICNEILTELKKAKK